VVDRDYILAPQVVSVNFALDPIFVQAESLSLLNELDYLSGVGEWVQQTYNAMTLQQRNDNLMAFYAAGYFLFGMIKSPHKHDGLVSYMDWLAQQNPEWLVEQVRQAYRHKFEGGKVGAGIDNFDRIWRERDVFVQFMQSLCEDEHREDVWNEAFDLMQQPPVFVERIRRHVHTMWEQYLELEWTRGLPLIQESIAAFQRMSFGQMTLYEVVRTVTGRDMRGKFDDYEAQTEHVIFVPALPHIGPYISKLPDGHTLKLAFSARLPRGAQTTSSALSRSEVLIRMNALADDTRLRILEMLTMHDELCAQDIIEALGLSQSSVSRHLSQLAATGFLIERRRDVNKCYSLNVDRVVDTVRALTNFLSRQ
jgi:DNA-binding transcriptional ArsR family regulator